MSTYKAQTAAPISTRVARFFEEFFANSDSSAAGNATRYADAFTADGVLVMGLAEAKGRADIVRLREGMWTGPVASRLHTVEKIYAFGEDEHDVMLFGSVKYGLKTKEDRPVVVQWAARAKLVDDEEDGPVRMSFYQVYLDSSVVANALKD